MTENTAAHAEAEVICVRCGDHITWVAFFVPECAPPQGPYCNEDCAMGLDLDD